jgi:hypothetical protein
MIHGKLPVYPRGPTHFRRWRRSPVLFATKRRHTGHWIRVGTPPTTSSSEKSSSDSPAGASAGMLGSSRSSGGPPDPPGATVAILDLYPAVSDLTIWYFENYVDEFKVELEFLNFSKFKLDQFEKTSCFKNSRRTNEVLWREKVTSSKIRLAQIDANLLI